MQLALALAQCGGGPPRLHRRPEALPDLGHERDVAFGPAPRPARQGEGRARQPPAAQHRRGDEGAKVECGEGALEGGRLAVLPNVGHMDGPAVAERGHHLRSEVVEPMRSHHAAPAPRRPVASDREGLARRVGLGDPDRVGVEMGTEQGRRRVHRVVFRRRGEEGLAQCEPERGAVGLPYLFGGIAQDAEYSGHLSPVGPVHGRARDRHEPIRPCPVVDEPHRHIVHLRGLAREGPLHRPGELAVGEPR